MNYFLLIWIHFFTSVSLFLWSLELTLRSNEHWYFFKGPSSSFYGCDFCNGLWSVSSVLISPCHVSLLSDFFSLLNWRHTSTLYEGSLSALIDSPPLLLGPRMRLSRVCSYLSHFLGTKKTRSAKIRIRYL